MKINFQKIIIVITALAISISSVSLVSFADDSYPMSTKDYYASQHYLTAQFVSGRISWDEYQTQSQSVTNEYINSNTVGGVLASGALHASNSISALSQKLGAVVNEYGDRAKDYLSDYISDFFDSYKVLSETPSFDMSGAGAVLVKYDGDLTTYYYSDSFGYVYHQEDPIRYVIRQNVFRMVLYKKGVVQSDTTGSMGPFTVIVRNGVTAQIYGDWRYYPDSEDIPPTDDEYIQSESFDFSNATDKELEDLLNKILEQLELQQPDLSSIEGLLRAIYNRLGTLDSDNDNALLSQILAAINSLELSGGEIGDNSGIISVLEDIKNSLVFNNGDGLGFLSEQLKEIIDNQLTVDDFAIDEDLYNNNDEILKLRLQQKFSFITSLKNLVIYTFNSYSNSPVNPEFSVNYDGKEYSWDFSFLNQYIDSFRFLIAAFIYISYAFHTYRKIPSYINGGDNE